MNNETLQILIEPRTDVNECMNANTHTFILDCNNLRYECTIALPCTNGIVCALLSEWLQFSEKQLPYANNVRVIEDENRYYWWTNTMQDALLQMRTKENLANDLTELGVAYQHNQLQLVKYLKNKYQFGLKETKELVDLYYLTL